MNETVLAIDYGQKRTELINTYAAGLDKMWDYGNPSPPDFFISSLGVSLLLGKRSEDSTINAKIDMASASLLYLATNTSLLMAIEYFKQRNLCNDIYFKNKPILDKTNLEIVNSDLCIPKSLDGREKIVEKNLCVNGVIRCQRTYEKYKYFLSSSYDSEYVLRPDFPRESQFTANDFLDSTLDSMLLGCNDSTNPWGSKVYKEAVVACNPLLNMFYADALLLSQHLWPKNGDCSGLTINNLPLILLFTNCNYKTSPILAMKIPALSTMKRNIILATPYNRSFYWMQMAEEAFERTKKIDKKAQEVNLDFNKFKELDYKINGASLCSSPSIEGKCLQFSQLFSESFKNRRYLDLMSLSFETVSTLGNSYNQKTKVTQKELAAMERLARDLPSNRMKSIVLKNELQELVDKSKMNFSFEKELREF